MKCITVGELVKRLAELPSDMLVFTEVRFNDNNEYEMGPLIDAKVETRCDGHESLYLLGDQDDEEAYPPEIDE